MKKTKKFAAAAVSLLLAGTMVGSLAGCNNNNDKKPNKDNTNTTGYAEGTKVRTALGYKDDTTAISFSGSSLPLVNKDGSKAGASIKLPDGTTYQKGELKPIWRSYESALKIGIEDKWPQTGSTLTDCVKEGISNYDLIGAGSLAEIQTQIDAGTLLNLNDYKEQLPNLMHFLDNNALAKLGTLSNTRTGATYYSPYYAGMNDAERFNLFRMDYVSELLDYADLSQAATKNGGTVTFKAQADKKKELELGNRGKNEVYVSNAASIESYMGQTGNYVVKTTDPADTLKTVYVKVDYDAALAAAKNTNTALGGAINTAAGKAYNNDKSGNIVDLQNFVINETNGEVKGEHLLSILREYIKVAYKWAESENATTWNQFYGAKVHNVDTKLSDIINANYAAWDVDIYAAIGRCYVTCGNFLGSHQSQASADTNYGASTWLLVTRTGKLDRLTRMVAMIGELYGVRGLESQTYLDSSGNLRQTRFNVSTWDAFSKFSAFHSEGLVPSFEVKSAGGQVGAIGSVGTNGLYDGTASHFQGLSSNDFIHTQTTLAGTNEYTSSTYVETTDGYTFTGVATPVSRWLTEDTSTVDKNYNITADTDGLLKDRPAAKTTVMRFTESALKLKTGGLVIPKTTASDPDRLNATLALLDYIYSNDGQIVTTFGERSDTDNLTGNDTDGYTTTNNGWWYGEEVKKLNINGTETDISGKTMEELKTLGVVETFDGGKQYSMTKAYQSQALVYQNKLYRTGTDGADTLYPNGYVYQGVMTPYYTRAVHKLCAGKVSINGYMQDGSAWSSTNLQNLLLGMESHGIVNNASMVQLCNTMALKGFDVISVTLGNDSAKTVSQGIGSNPWYTCAPSVTLPKSASDQINDYTDFTKLFATKSGSDLLSNYFFTEVGWYGANATLDGFSVKAGDVSSPEKIVAYLKGIAPAYESLNNAAWAVYYNYYTGNN